MWRILFTEGTLAGLDDPYSTYYIQEDFRSINDSTRNLLRYRSHVKPEQNHGYVPSSEGVRVPSPGTGCSQGDIGGRYLASEVWMCW